ncbi:MAG: beta-ketoacyl-[acyl-carrier-protein] synthase II [Bacteroidetes bacterium]|nr:MAG: beta-ketoacyl-[acyl-carrier-protein] synthase II [Bacteroidota bacterium]PTM09325.1 MAG: beta-ketoacyl-[acyl-carrier-protein] synthase II [Bacteroidota bacterium]
MRRVVITGLGALTPIGNTVTAYLEGLQKGVSGANRITYFDPVKFKTQFACEIKDFEPTDFIDRREVRRLDRFVIYALVAADEALQNSGIDMGQLDLDRSGVIWASGIGGLRSLEEEIVYNASSDQPRYNPFMIPKMIGNMGAGHISMKYGLRGPSYGVVSACASTGHALGAAADDIRLGRSDFMVVGGSEAAVTEVGIGGFSAMKALSTRNDDFATASRPYDAERDGFVLGEGAGCLILEELEHAKARGATIYAELMGYAATSDAYHITAPHPEGLGASNCMRNALQFAGISPADVDYINTHGTSTPLGDGAELKAIQKVFGQSIYDLNISSTKSMTGHLLGAAGAIENIACVLAIQHKFVPPTINHFNPDPEIDPRINLTFNEVQERDVKVALSNTFGFGGHNSAAVFKRFEG